MVGRRQEGSDAWGDCWIARATAAVAISQSETLLRKGMGPAEQTDALAPFDAGIVLGLEGFALHCRMGLGWRAEESPCHPSASWDVRLNDRADRAAAQDTDRLGTEATQISTGP